MTLAHFHSSQLLLGGIMVLVLWIAFPLFASAQVEGRVSDVGGEPIPGVVLTLSQEVAPDSLLVVGYAISKSDGSFRINYATEKGEHLEHKALWLEARLMGFRPQKVRVVPREQVVLALEEESILLSEVTVLGEPVRRSNDTTTYVVELLRRQDDKTLEQILKRLPGVSVDPTGSISVDGKPINKFYIEGLDMLGRDYDLVTQNIHPQDVASIQVLSNHQPIKLLQDVVLSEASAINIKLREKSKFRPIGRGYLAGGYDRRAVYDAHLFGLLVRQRRQHLVTLESNAIGKINPERQNILSRSNIDFVLNKFLPPTLLEDQPIGTPSIPMAHYRDNYSARATAHSLFRLSNDSQVAPKLSYSYDTESYAIQRKIVTSDLGAAPITIEEESHPSRSTHTLHSSIDYELNKDNVYIKNSAIGFATFREAQIGLQGGDIIEQANSLKEYHLLNNFSFMHRGRIIQRMGALLSWRHTPTHYMTLTDHSGKSMRQIAEGGQFFGGLSYSAAKQLFEVLDGTLEVEATAEDNSIRTANTPSSDRNTLRTTHLILSIRPAVKYQNEGWILSATLPMSMRSLQVQDKEEATHSQIRIFTPDYTLFARYMPNAYWTFGLRNRHTHSFGGAEDYLLHPIQKDFREVVILGSGLFRHNQVNSTSFSAKYNDPISGFYIMSTTTYMKRWLNLSSNTDIGRDRSTMGILTHRRETNQVHQSLQLKQVFFQSKTSLSLNIDYTYMDNRIYRIGKPIDIKNHLFGSRAGISTSLFGGVMTSDIDVLYSKHLSTQEAVSGAGSSSSTDLWKLSAEARVYCSDVLSLFGGYDAVWNRGMAQDHYKLYHHSSIGVEYQGAGWELELLLSNLTNQRNYLETSYRGLDYYETNTLLRPRQILLRWTYRY